MSLSGPSAHLIRICYMCHAATESLGQRSFSYCAPKIWNDIQLSVRQSLSLDSFKHNLKSHYFANNWPPGDCLQRLWFDIFHIVRFKNRYEWMNEWMNEWSIHSSAVDFINTVGRRISSDSGEDKEDAFFLPSNASTVFCCLSLFPMTTKSNSHSRLFCFYSYFVDIANLSVCPSVRYVPVPVYQMKKA